MRSEPDWHCSVINPVDFPFGVGFVRTNELALLQLHVVLGAGPRFFVPPISRKKKRPSLINDLSADFVALKMSILNAYLPQAMSADELSKVVDETIAEIGATSKAQMGAVMKALQAKVGGRADGKTLSQEVTRQLGS